MSDDTPDDGDDAYALSGFDGNPELTRSDLGLFQQALRADWPLSPQTRNWMLREIGKLATSCKSKRTRLIAFKTLLATSSLNIRQQTLDLARDKFEAERDQSDAPSAVDVVKEMQASAERYERDRPDSTATDRGGAGEVPDGPEPVQ